MKQSHRTWDGGVGVIDSQILNSHLPEGRRDERRRIDTRELRYSKINLFFLREICKGLLRC